MALVLKDRVRETTTTTGTGTVTLNGAVTGFESFSAVGNGNTTYYTIAGQSNNEWEVGIGTYTASGSTLSRDTVLSSSNGGALVNFSTGTKDVFVTYPAEKAIFEEVNGTTVFNGGPITVIGPNVTSYTQFTETLSQMYANVNNFAQSYVQNLNNGAEASADFAAYNNLSDGSNYFVDMGISSSNGASTAYPILAANAGYLISYGDGASPDQSDLYVGSGDGKVTVFAGSFETTAKVAEFKPDLSTELKGALDVAGTANIDGATTFGSTVTLAADPTANLQAATKQYVDNATAAGLTIHTPVRVERGSNLNATYNNGTAGVGATLTNAGTQVALVIDGITVSVNDRVLVYGQTNAAENGIYTVTNTGSGSTNWVLTRATDADSYAANSTTALGEGAYFYVTSGNTGAGESYVLTTKGTITFGTTAIVFTQFNAVPTFTGGTNIDVTGQVISLTGTVAATNGGTGVNTVATGDLLYGSGTNTWAKLAKGAAHRALVMDSSGTNVSWSAVQLNEANAVSGSLGPTNGGTGISSYATGDTLFASAANTLSKLAGNTDTTPKYLRQVGTGSASAAPTWSTLDAGDITSGQLAIANGGTGASSASTARTNLGATTLGSNLFTIFNPSAITFPRFNADNTVSSLTASDFRTAIGAGTGDGTVTSITAGTGLTGGTITGSGTIAIDSTVTTLSGTQTLTNKRITPRVSQLSANSATPAINTDNFDMVVITGQTTAITSFTTNLTGTPTIGQRLWISVTGTTSIAITWGTAFEASTVALPTTTVSTNRLDVGFVWNTATSRWRCVAVA